MTELVKVLDDLNKGKYERTMVNNMINEQSDIGPNKGKMVFVDNLIKFERVPLVTPNGDILVKELTFEVK